MVVRSHVLTRFKVEKLLSAVAVLTGNVANIFNNEEIIGNISLAQTINEDIAVLGIFVSMLLD